MQKYFNLSIANQIDKWKLKGLSNQYLNGVGTAGDGAGAGTVSSKQTNKTYGCNISGKRCDSSI